MYRIKRSPGGNILPFSEWGLMQLIGEGSEFVFKGLFQSREVWQREREGLVLKGAGEFFAV